MIVGRLALTTVRLAVPLYLASVVLGLVPTTVAMLGLVPLAADRPWRADLLSPGWMNVAAEILMQATYSSEPLGLLLLVVAGLFLLPLALIGQVVAYSFLAGGILETLHAGAGAQPVFWDACRRWFGPFLRISLLGGVLAFGIAMLSAILSGLAQPLIGPDISTLVQFALQALILGWLEVARAWMVAESERSVRRALVRAARVAARPLVLVLWLLLALPATGVMLAVMLPPSIDDPYAPMGLVQALLFAQILAFAGAWIKVMRLAVAVWLTAAAQPEESAALATPAKRSG